MSNAYKRKKEPALVRRALLDEAARIGAMEGLAGVTVASVAKAAGVTKGGLLHHFPSKQELIDTLFDELLEQLERMLDARVETDPEPYGRFTRAYLYVSLQQHVDRQSNPLATLSITMLTDAKLRERWRAWYEACLTKFVSTDDAAPLQAVRLAADGAWLAELSGVTILEREQVCRQLIAMTYR